MGARETTEATRRVPRAVAFPTWWFSFFAIFSKSPTATSITRSETRATIFSFDVERETISYDCQVSVLPNLFGVSCGAPVRIPPAQRGKVAEYIARVNFTAGLGHLSLEFSDGEVRYRVVQQVVPSLANEPLLIANFFERVIHSMNAHLPFVSGVAFEGTSPEQAAQTYLRAVSAEAGYCRQLAGEQAIPARTGRASDPELGAPEWLRVPEAWALSWEASYGREGRDKGSHSS
jgi:hypothetical protein